MFESYNQVVAVQDATKFRRTSQEWLQHSCSYVLNYKTHVLLVLDYLMSDLQSPMQRATSPPTRAYSDQTRTSPLIACEKYTDFLKKAPNTSLIRSHNLSRANNNLFSASLKCA